MARKPVEYVDKIHLSDVKIGQFIDITGKGIYVVVKRDKFKYAIIPIDLKHSETYNTEASDYEELPIKQIFDAKNGDTLVMVKDGVKNV